MSDNKKKKEGLFCGRKVYHRTLGDEVYLPNDGKDPNLKLVTF